MKLNIGILGTRGIPNHYGGFEQIAGHLSKGLVQKGHSVTVYNCHNHPYKQNEWHGVSLIHCYNPGPFTGMAGQFIYDLNCIRDARRRQFDILLILGYTSSSVWRKLYPKQSVVITNMDGLEWKRTKYSRPVRAFLRHAESLSARSGDFFIADALPIKKYLEKKYGIEAAYLPYGAELLEPDPSDLKPYRVAPQNYCMLMARMEPENNIEMILDGFTATPSMKQFLVIGNTNNRLGKFFRSKYAGDPRIRFIGPLFDSGILASLIHGAHLYFHGHSVGGTNPSLLEAMAGRGLIAAHDNEFNRALLCDNACYFDSAVAVGKIIQHTIRGEKETLMIENNYNRICGDFNWDTIISRYEDFFYACLSATAGNHALWRQPCAYPSRLYDDTATI